MQKHIQKFRQSFTVFEKPGILSGKLKILTSSNYRKMNIFANVLHTFPTYHCLLKGVQDFLLFCLDLELFAKIKNDLVSTHSLKPFLLIVQDLNKIRKIPNTLF